MSYDYDAYSSPYRTASKYRFDGAPPTSTPTPRKGLSMHVITKTLLVAGINVIAVYTAAFHDGHLTTLNYVGPGLCGLLTGGIVALPQRDLRLPEE